MNPWDAYIQHARSGAMPNPNATPAATPGLLQSAPAPAGVAQGLLAPPSPAAIMPASQPPAAADLITSMPQALAPGSPQPAAGPMNFLNSGSFGAKYYSPSAPGSNAGGGAPSNGFWNPSQAHGFNAGWNVPKPVQFDIAAGTQGLGGAHFGAGVSTSRSNEFDPTVVGSGLYAAGIDPRKPGYENNLLDSYNHNRFGVGSSSPYFPSGTNSTSPSIDAIQSATDTQLRESEKKAQLKRRQGGFGDWLLGALPAIAGGLIGGPLVGAAISAGQGSATGTGLGVGRALLGAV